MEIKTEITISLPPMLAAALGITEDTLFETYFDGNCLRVRTLDEEEVESAILAGLEQLSITKTQRSLWICLATFTTSMRS